jgi:hypothetical protein
MSRKKIGYEALQIIVTAAIFICPVVEQEWFFAVKMSIELIRMVRKALALEEKPQAKDYRFFWLYPPPTPTIIGGNHR